MIKIDLITGFLGAGKTTFIRKYAKYLMDSGKNIGILENDFGAVNVDMMMLQDLMGDQCELEMISGGCDPETHRRRFKTKLISMGMCGYDRILVEPSGIFDVDEFFDILHEEPLDRWYEPGSVITIVDANLEEEMSEEENYILASEAASAGKIVFSKIGKNLKTEKEAQMEEKESIAKAEELKEEMTSLGEKPYRAEQIFKWIYKDKVKEFDEMTNLSIELREKLQQNYTMCNFKILKKQESSDGTKKYLFDVLDGNAIETVLMSYHHGYSICVSSQIGCKMGCKFCASTGIKFVRSLTSGEIVEQILAVEQDENIRISNIVFMGIGEPLDNFDNVINAVKIINNPKGLNIGARHISISTSGLVPMIYKLAEQNTQCTLSISLHATTNEKRSSMMPVNNAYNIEELIQACKDYIKVTNRRISFEYALAKDNNDNLEDAKRLVKLLKGMLCHVNLIPINKIENGEYTKSSNENIIKFRDYLNDHGIVATIRRELGSDIDAACGQLRRKNLKEEK